MKSQDPTLKSIKHGTTQGDSLGALVHELADDAANALARDVTEQMRYGKLHHNPIIVGLVPMVLGGGRVYVAMGAFVLDRSDVDGKRLLAAFAPALELMLRETQATPETKFKLE